MKSFLVGLLAALTLALLAFIGIQWQRELRLHKRIDGLARDLAAKKVQVEDIQQSLARTEAEIARLDAARTELEAANKTNRLQLRGLDEEIAGLDRDLVRNASTAKQYDEAGSRLGENVERAKGNLAKQEEMITRLNREREDFIRQTGDLQGKYSQLQTGYTNINTAYTNLVAQFAEFKKQSGK